MNIFWQIILRCLIKKLFEFFFIVKYIPPRVGFGFPSLSSIISYIVTTRLNGRAGSDSYNKLTCENLVMGRCLEILILEGVSGCEPMLVVLSLRTMTLTTLPTTPKIISQKSQFKKSYLLIL